MDTKTIYNYSNKCTKCNKIVGPVERLFSTSNEVCLDCRNKEFRNTLKNRMVTS